MDGQMENFISVSFIFNNANEGETLSVRHHVAPN
jgi:hypothetical protein